MDAKEDGATGDGGLDCGPVAGLAIEGGDVLAESGGLGGRERGRGGEAEGAVAAEEAAAEAEIPDQALAPVLHLEAGAGHQVPDLVGGEDGEGAVGVLGSEGAGAHHLGGGDAGDGAQVQAARGLEAVPVRKIVQHVVVLHEEALLPPPKVRLQFHQRSLEPQRRVHLFLARPQRRLRPVPLQRRRFGLDQRQPCRRGS